MRSLRPGRPRCFPRGLEMGLGDADVPGMRAVRALRMGLREVAGKLLGDRRWRALALPVTPEEDPDYWERVRRALRALPPALI